MNSELKQVMDVVKAARRVVMTDPGLCDVKGLLEEADVQSEFVDFGGYRYEAADGGGVFVGRVGGIGSKRLEPSMAGNHAYGVFVKAAGRPGVCATALEAVKRPRGLFSAVARAAEDVATGFRQAIADAKRAKEGGASD